MSFRSGSGDQYTVGTVHLESVFDDTGPSIRSKQLSVIIPELSANSTLSICMGDFNSTGEEEVIPRFLLFIEKTQSSL